MIKTLDYVVVGAGISGLSAAFELEKNSLSGVVLEASDKAGGCIESVRAENFHQELGAHSLFNSYGGVIKMISSLSIEDQIITKEKMPFLLWSQDKVSSIFKALNLPLMFISVFKILWHKKSNETVVQFYGAITGKKNYTKIIRHALNAVACQNMDLAPANFLFQKRARHKNFMRKFSFEQGMQAFTDALGRSLKIQYKTNVHEVRWEDDRYLLSTDQGQFYCKFLLLATPVKVAADLVKNINPEVSALLGSIQASHFSSVAVMVKRDKLKLDECAGWIGVQGDFYSMVSADPVNSLDSYRGFTFHFKPNVGSKQEQVEKIRKMLNVGLKDIKHIIYKENTLPIIAKQHFQQAQKIDMALQAKSLGLSGNYFYGMSIEDCVQRSFSEVNRMMDK